MPTAPTSSAIVPPPPNTPGVDLLSAGATLTGTSGPDTLTGGDGADTIAGRQGADLLNGAGGDDTIRWDPGDGSDIVNGGTGFDTLLFNGANIAEHFDLVAAGDHLRLTRDVSAIGMDVDNVERVVIRTLGEADTVTIGALRGTDVRQVDIDLAGSGGGGDSATDTVVFDGLAGGATADRIIVSTAGGVTSATGLGVGLAISGAEAADRLTLHAGGGADTLDASALAGGIGVNFDGGEGNDVLALNGGAGGDRIELAPNGGATPDGLGLFVVANGATSQLSLLSVESIAINTGAGDDEFSGQNGLSAFSVSVNGADGNDSLRGGDGNDTLMGGVGADFIDGNRGNDLQLGGDGDDTIQWDPGDGSDTVNGGGGVDTMQFNGSNIGETIRLSASAGGHAVLTRDVASINMDLDNVERVAIRALGGIDNLTIDDLNGTDLRQVDIDLGAFDGQGDAAVDSVTLRGHAGGQHIVLSSAGGVVSVTGMTATVTVSHAESSDRLLIFAGSGNDQLDASALTGQIGVTLVGLDGNDSVRGSHADDQLTGDNGDDTIVSGDGNDVLAGGTGQDRFVFTAGETGRDFIVDFQAHDASGRGDLLVLNGFGDHSFAEAVAAGHIVESGGDVLVGSAAGTIVTLANVSLLSLHASDFLFG